MKIAFRYKSSKKIELLTGLMVEPKTEYNFDIAFKETRLTKSLRDCNYRGIQFEAPNGATITLIINSSGWVEDVRAGYMVKTPLGYFASIRKASKFFEIEQRDIRQRIQDNSNRDFELVRCDQIHA